MTCPDCERFKLSAAMWRNKAYELGGTPLPWDADKKIEEAVAAEREACAKLCETYETVSIRHEAPSTAMIFNHCAKAIRERGSK
jgi:hypothetical protein